MGNCLQSFPQVTEQPYRIIAFDWDSTAVADGPGDAGPVAAIVSELLDLETFIVVITGRNFLDIDRQFSSLIQGERKRRLFICANRGSEVYGFDRASGPLLLYRKEATGFENKTLDRIAAAVKGDMERRGSVKIGIIRDRLNLRKIDLIPEWRDLPGQQTGELLTATQDRLRDGGFQGGIHSAFELAERYAREFGLADARITSDVKHIEVGLTDKSDSLEWVTRELARSRNIPYGRILVAGGEFGPVAGFEGSDFRMVLPGVKDITYVSVGKEPGGVPPGVKWMGGGTQCLLRLLGSQVRLLRELRPTVDPAWRLLESGFNPLREREIESLMAIGNGYLGTRGSIEEQIDESDPVTLVAGVYDRTDARSYEELIIAPDWIYTQVYSDDEPLRTRRADILHHARLLDMNKGLLLREWRHRGPNNRVTHIRFLRFASLDDPHALLQQVTVTPENYRAQLRVSTGTRICGTCRPALQVVESEGQEGGPLLFEGRTAFTNITLVEAQKSRYCRGFIEAAHALHTDELDLLEDWTWYAGEGEQLTIQKFSSIYTSRDDPRPARAARAHVRRLEGHGFDRLLLDHIDAWRARWRVSAITLGEDPRAQHALNFAGYHLISAGNPGDEHTSISARSLTGSIYKGHVFWDSEMFILPFFIFTHPPTARSMLMYRFHTLAAARRNAEAHGFRGALFAWESTITGDDMTPQAVLSPSGEIVPVLSGKLEHHLDAAVAWGVWSYWNATRDDGFLIEAGAELMLETARFWAACGEFSKGKYHINHVEGPDEFHEEGVDDNFYTNAMAAWNLRTAAVMLEYMKEKHPVELARLQDRTGLQMDELAEWRRVADAMCLGADRDGVIEQFDGYFSLEDIDVSRFRPGTVAPDIILGRDRTMKSQMVKQADVVMALYLLEDSLQPEAIRRSFDYYEPRTVHGSSLSPAIYGLVAARLGLRDKALEYFRRASDIDIIDGNAVGGIHVAALGGLWQQVIMGFAGVRINMEGITFWPVLPDEWETLRFCLLWRGAELHVSIIRGEQLRVEVHGEPGQTVLAAVHGQPLMGLEAGQAYASAWLEAEAPAAEAEKGAVAEGRKGAVPVAGGGWQQFVPEGGSPRMHVESTESTS